MHSAPDRSQSQAVLGVDLGTSAVKCVVVAGGQILGAGSADLEVANPFPGWSEQNPSDWCSAATKAIQSACMSSGLNKASIVGVGLSGQMHGAVLLDADANPLRPAILWNDNRSLNECADLSAAMPEIGQVAGIVPLPGFTAPKLMWVREHEPGIYAKIHKIVLPKDYLTLWFTGEIGTDVSDAAGTLWLDQKARDWSAALSEASGIDAAWLPTLRNGFEAVGALRPDVAETLGLAPGITVFAGGGDAAAGAIALGAAAPGRCMISLGTSGQLLVVDDAYAPDPDKFVHAFCHTLPGTWYRMAAMLNGARPLAWFAHVLGISVEDMIEQSKTADPKCIPLFLPYLTGERSPHGDPRIRGSFYGLEDSTGAPEMARAVIEAVAFSMAEANQIIGIENNTTAPIPVIGGGSRSDIVLQALADAMGRSVARAKSGHGGAAYGAALLAEVGLGIRHLRELAFEPQIEVGPEPTRDPSMMARFETYKALYTALRPFAAVQRL